LLSQLARHHPVWHVMGLQMHGIKRPLPAHLHRAIVLVGQHLCQRVIAKRLRLPLCHDG